MLAVIAVALAGVVMFLCRRRARFRDCYPHLAHRQDADWKLSDRGEN